MKKKKLLIPVLASLVTVLVLSGVSYAYYSAKIKENNKTETVLKSNELNLIFNGVKESSVMQLERWGHFINTTIGILTVLALSVLLNLGSVEAAITKVV